MSQSCSNKQSTNKEHARCRVNTSMTTIRGYLTTTNLASQGVMLKSVAVKLHLLDGAIVVTELKHLNGEEVRMELVPCVTRAVCIMRNFLERWEPTKLL